MILGWSSHKILDFCADQKSKMAVTTGHSLILDRVIPKKETFKIGFSMWYCVKLCSAEMTTLDFQSK
jgi:hypothetical protein